MPPLQMSPLTTNNTRMERKDEEDNDVEETQFSDPSGIVLPSVGIEPLSSPPCDYPPLNGFRSLFCTPQLWALYVYERLCVMYHTRGRNPYSPKDVYSDAVTVGQIQSLLKKSLLNWRSQTVEKFTSRLSDVNTPVQPGLYIISVALYNGNNCLRRDALFEIFSSPVCEFDLDPAVRQREHHKKSRSFPSYYMGAMVDTVPPVEGVRIQYLKWDWVNALKEIQGAIRHQKEEKKKTSQFLRYSAQKLYNAWCLLFCLNPEWYQSRMQFDETKIGWANVYRCYTPPVTK
jgi:hypothetical protein